MIGLNDFRRHWAVIKDDASAAFEATAASGWYVLGREVKEFEAELGRYWGLSHVVGVASGLDAIEISLRVLGCSPGDKVLTTPVSAFATTLAIVKLGAIPIFVDTDDRGLIDLDAVETVLRADSSIRYFVPVHLFGHALNLEQLQRLSAEFDLALVEDCAQSIGANWHARATGTAGAMAATSFYPTKNLGAMGDGGAILTNDEELARKAAVLRDYGQSAKYHHSEIGYNSRLDEIQASLLRRAALPRLAQWTARRREIAARYLAEIVNANVGLSRDPAPGGSCWHLFPVTIAADRKSCFMGELKSRGILTGEHYPRAIPDQTALAGSMFQIAPGGLPRARTFCSSEVSLPIHPYLNDDEVSQVIEAVNCWRC